MIDLVDLSALTLMLIILFKILVQNRLQQVV